jgi:hypothetical protein
MSDLFSFDTQASAPLEAAARANSVDSLDELDTPAFRGTFKGIGTGIMRGGAKTADFMQTVGSFFDEPTTDKEALDSFADEVRKDSIDFWTPAPHEVGKVGQTLGSFGEILLPLAATGGNPSVLMGTQAIERGKDLVNEGVSAPVAVAAGTTEALATGLGFKIPVVGQTLASRLASGAAGNLAFGAATRGAEGALFKATGYEDQAPPVLDLASVTTDALTGLLFGGLHHTLSPHIDPRLAPSQADAVMAARNTKSFTTETAPGKPADIASEVAHQDALQTALEQLSRNEPVDVSQTVTEQPATFADTGKLEESAQIARDVEASQPTDVPYEPGPTLTQRFEGELAADPTAAEARYKALPESEDGKVLNTDVARELSPEYQTDRSLSAQVHEPASAFIKDLYAKRLAEPPKPGEDPLVVFSSGGTGAGKSVGLKASGIADRAQIVYDTNMNRLESATQKIDQALAAGKDVEVFYTFRDPIEALRNGALTRAMRQEAAFGSGRTVPLNEHIATHTGARDVIEQIAAHYAGDDRVRIRVLDNSHGKGGSRITPLREIPKLDQAHNQLHEEARRVLDEELAAGRISEAVYRGFSEQSARRESGPSRANDRGQSEPASAKPVAPPASSSEAGKASDVPELAALQQLAGERPDAPIYSGFDADGQPIQSTLADIADQIQREYAQDLKDAEAYSVAVQCFLGRGA